MANYKVTDTELTGIANAIRTRGGTSAQLEFPDDFSSAIGAIGNIYVQGDEGKVVSNGALVAQTARSSDITNNGTYDTTLNNSVTVDVAGSGGESIVVDKYAEDFQKGYINGGTFYYDSPGISYRNDVWKVKSGHKYIMVLGGTTGNRFRAAFSTTDYTQATANVSGYQFGEDMNDPPAYCIKGGQNIGSTTNFQPFTPQTDGYVIVTKSNTGTDNIPCRLIDVSI